MATQILTRLPITTRIAMLVAIPMILIMVFSSTRLFDLYKQTQIDTTVAGELVETVSNLVHSLQAERGMSAGFLASKGDQVPEALAKVTQDNDALSSSFEDIMPRVDLENLSDDTLATIDELEPLLAGIGEIRNQIVQRDIEIPEVVDFYTELNAHLIDIALAVSLTVEDKNIAEQGMALSFFLLTKDSVGIERATGSVGFAAVWTPKRVRKLAIAVQRTEERMRSFHSTASVHALGLLKELQSNADYQEMMTIRQNVIDRKKAEIKSITQEMWFATASAALSAMKDMENALVTKLRADMHAFETGNRNAFIWNLAGLSTLVVVILLLSVLVARDLNRGLAGLNNALEELGNSNLDIDIPGADRKDELGSMARSVVTLREGAIQKRATDAQIEKSRREQAWMAQRVGDALSNLNEKQLTYRIEEEFPEEFKALRNDFNDSAQALENALSSVSQLADTVGSGTKSISENATNLAQRTESQASALEETTAAMNELTQSVRQSAENADEVEAIAKNARVDVSNCSEVVKDTVSAMEEIRESSGEISSITKVIEDIAFQTNLLALNAGVEAARAGEAGRGFAVVASEVRVLAKRCSDAVGQIDELTNRSAGLVDRGADLVDRAGNSMDNVNDQVTKISGLMEEIAMVIKEQAHQLSDINGAVGELEQVTQQNAAMVEETTEASVQLSHQAVQLNQHISEFSISDGETTAPAQTWHQVA